MKSMTGFARADGADAHANWYVEIRSVNGRGLDMRLRVPPGMDALEAKIRASAQARLARGNVSITLQLDRAASAPQLVLNEAALAQVLAAVSRVRALTGGPAPTPEGLLSLRGVLETVECKESETEQVARQAAMLATFETALDAFIANRAGEGARLSAILAAAVGDIETLITTVTISPARRPDAIAAKLRDQIARLSGGTNALEKDRLHQEAILLATKADVEEELQRLTVHVAAARDLIAEDAAVGRKFDFLTQEFNREANTLCSKANAPDISRAGLAMKVVIDQMREQVANIE
jgi:uncharacterized protein (TIGR00255 family)